MKKEVNKRSNLIKMIKEEFDRINEKTIIRVAESFPSRFDQRMKKTKDKILYQNDLKYWKQ